MAIQRFVIVLAFAVASAFTACHGFVPKITTTNYVFTIPFTGHVWKVEDQVCKDDDKRLRMEDLAFLYEAVEERKGFYNGCRYHSDLIRKSYLDSGYYRIGQWPFEYINVDIQRVHQFPSRGVFNTFFDSLCYVGKINYIDNDSSFSISVDNGFSLGVGGSEWLGDEKILDLGLFSPLAYIEKRANGNDMYTVVTNLDFYKRQSPIISIDNRNKLFETVDSYKNLFYYIDNWTLGRGLYFKGGADSAGGYYHGTTSDFQPSCIIDFETEQTAEYEEGDVTVREFERTWTYTPTSGVERTSSSSGTWSSDFIMYVNTYDNKLKVFSGVEKEKGIRRGSGYTEWSYKKDEKNISEKNLTWHSYTCEMNTGTCYVALCNSFVYTNSLGTARFSDEDITCFGILNCDMGYEVDAGRIDGYDLVGYPNSYIDTEFLVKLNLRFSKHERGLAWFEIVGYDAKEMFNLGVAEINRIAGNKGYSYDYVFKDFENSKEYEDVDFLVEESANSNVPITDITDVQGQFPANSPYGGYVQRYASLSVSMVGFYVYIKNVDMNTGIPKEEEGGEGGEGGGGESTPQ